MPGPQGASAGRLDELGRRQTTVLRQAQDGSRDVAGPRVRAMLRVREAWALAALGRAAAFARATEQARQDLADAAPGDEPYWIGYFDNAELAGTTGGRLLEPARQDARTHAERAGEEIRTALAERSPKAGRSNALDQLRGSSL